MVRLGVRCSSGDQHERAPVQLGVGYGQWGRLEYRISPQENIDVHGARRPARVLVAPHFILYRLPHREPVGGCRVRFGFQNQVQERRVPIVTGVCWQQRWGLHYRRHAQDLQAARLQLGDGVTQIRPSIADVRAETQIDLHSAVRACKLPFLIELPRPGLVHARSSFSLLAAKALAWPQLGAARHGAGASSPCPHYDRQYATHS